jgi:N-methylhydantoinase A/oxoprolinase/acetone carboxylase beta subunit
MTRATPEVRYRFGFDIGGTFTDLVLSGSNGAVRTGKLLSRHDDILEPILQGDPYRRPTTADAERSLLEYATRNGTVPAPFPPDF